MELYINKMIFSVIFIFVVLCFGDSVYCQDQNRNKEYIVGSGDRLTIQVWDHDDLNRFVEVSNDGTFSFPFIGTVKASGNTVSTIEQIIAKKLSDGYIVGPQVTATISEYNNQKVFLFGEVTNPGTYILKQKMHLMELISEAGGFTQNRGNLCTIVRSAENNDKKMPLAIDEVSDQELISINISTLAQGNIKQNIIIEPNDSIYVSMAENVFVVGEVRKPGKVSFIEGMTVRQAISMAGGETTKASLRRIRISRLVNGEESEVLPSLGDKILPNDILKVPESFF